MLAGKASQAFKIGGNIVGGIGISITAYQYFEQGSITGKEFTVDTIMGVAGFLGPWGAAASLVYFGSKGIYEYYSGETVFDKPNK